MPARVAVAMCALLFTGASATRGASATPNFSAEAADVSNMMESVRQRTEGGKAPAAAAPAVARPVAAERFPDLDAELMSRADQIGRQMEESAAAAESAHTVKRAALAAETSEPGKSRAARFFAVHGMSEVGRLLGDELSAPEATKALRAAADAERVLSASAGPTASLVRRTAVAVPAKPAAAASFNDLDMELAEEEDAKNEKQRWGAVDRLRRRARPM